MQTSEPPDLQFFRNGILSSSQTGVPSRLYGEELPTSHNTLDPRVQPNRLWEENPNDRLVLLAAEIHLCREQNKPIPPDVVDEAEAIIVSLTAPDATTTELPKEIEEIALEIARIRAQNEEESLESASQRLLGKFAAENNMSPNQTLGTAVALVGAVVVGYTWLSLLEAWENMGCYA